jgi:hypothetical protein
MWGPWFVLTLGGLLVFLLFVAIAFGTSALLIPVLIAPVILLVGAFLSSLSKRRRNSLSAGAGAPVSGEGGAPQPSHAQPRDGSPRP